MDYTYKVVPFAGQVRGAPSASDVASQLDGIINQYATQGWEFCQLADVHVEVQPGCLAGLFGAQTEYVQFNQLIFRTAGSAATSTARAEAFAGDVERHSSLEEASEWRCSCGQRNPPSTGACLECGSPK